MSAPLPTFEELWAEEQQGDSRRSFGCITHSCQHQQIHELAGSEQEREDQFRLYRQSPCSRCFDWSQPVPGLGL